jgi:hypothetical protein
MISMYKAHHFLGGKWYISRNGISLNEGGRFLTFSLLKLRGKIFIHFFIYLFIGNKKISFSKYF